MGRFAIAACVGVGVAILAATTAPAEERVRVVKKDPSEPVQNPDEISWSWAVVSQAYDLIDEKFPAFEVQHAIRRDKNHPNSLALAFWGSRKTSYDDPIFGSAYFGFATAPKTRTTARSMYGLAARYKLYLMRSFHFNFGAGGRTTSTTETATFDAGDKVSAAKSATVLGADIGLGNRWVLANGLVIGGNWLQTFLPVVALSSKDASIPAGYQAQSAKSDAKHMSFRLVAIDLGYAW